MVRPRNTGRRKRQSRSERCGGPATARQKMPPSGAGAAQVARIAAHLQLILQGNYRTPRGMPLADQGVAVPARGGPAIIAIDRRSRRMAMVFLAGAAQHVLGKLGSLQQTAASALGAPSAGASGLFNVDSSTQSADTASSGAGGTGSWWSSPSTMNALLSAQDPGATGSSSGSATSAQGHHGGHHHHAASTGDTGQNTSGAGTTTDSPSGSSTATSGANSGPAGLFSQLINTQMLSATPAGQSLSTLV